MSCLAVDSFVPPGTYAFLAVVSSGRKGFSPRRALLKLPSFSPNTIRYEIDFAKANNLALSLSESLCRVEAK
jgi:hypothetical protein